MKSRSSAGRCRPLMAAALLALPVPSLAADPVVNEILYRPGTGFPEATQLEFVELYNPGSEPADLSGWAFNQGVRYTFPAGTVLAGGGYLVVAADPAALLAARPGLAAEAVLGPWEAGLKLSNRGETLTLAAPDPGAGDGWRTVDRVSYAHEGDWATRTRDSLGGWSWITQANGGGCSTERRNPLLAVDSGQNWADSAAVGGTPGRVNSRFVANVAPVIQKVRHHPAVPTSAEPVTVSCELTDEADLSTLSARLWWRPATTTTPGAFQSLGMTHEGNGRFSATLAPMPNKAIIEFYIAATDGTLTRTWPAPNSEGQTTNCTYQVDNEVITGTAPAYRLVLTAAENAAFAAVNAQSDRMFALTLVASHGGETTIRYRTAMRIRGNSSRGYTIKPLRISMPTDDRWDGVSDFTIGPRGAPVQFLAHKIQRAAGLVASDATPIELRRNGVEQTVASGSTADYGRLTRIEEIDGDYLDNHFPEAVSAQVYRKVSVSSWNANSAVPATPDGIYSGWSKQNASAANDWSDVVAFTNTWQTLAAPHFSGAVAGHVASGTWRGTAFTEAEMATLATIVDLDYLARWLAVMTIIPNNEPNLSTGEDDDYAAVFANDGTHTRMFPAPHDMDTTFGTGEVAFPYNISGLYDITETDTSTQRNYRPGLGPVTLMAPLLPLLGNSSTPGNATFRAQYLTAIRELFGSVFDADTSDNPNPPFHQFVDNHLRGWVPDANRNAIKTFMTNRQAYLLGLIGAPKIVPPAGTSHASLAAPSAGAVRINEILAVNNTAHAVGERYPDLVELRNTGAETCDLSGHSLSDADGNSYIFPEGSVLEAGEFLLLTETTLGFGFSGSGDSLTLADAGGAPLDSVAFGPQVADLSIGRLAGNEDSWGLVSPTPGAANGAAVALAEPSGLALNEWAGNIDFRLSGDFVELHNPGAAPVALGGMAVTDDLRSYPQRFAFPPLSYLATGSYLALDSDALGFGIDGRFDDLWLIGANGGVIGRASAISQFADASTGLSPDGGRAWADFPLPTPGMSNATDPGAHADLLAWLRITEIHFAPTGGGDYEFIELRNGSGTVTLDLSGVRFTKGIDYTFPAGTTLVPGAYAVVCKKRSSYLSRYTEAAAVAALAPGSFSGSLDNSGEQLALTLPAPWQLNILRFRYEPGWYPLATGGHSLVTRDAAATAARDWGESTIWVASGVPHGTPGGDDPPVITSPLAANGVRGDAFSYLIAATKSPTSYGADGLPAGLALDPATGLITGTPGETGEFTVTLSASNGSATGNAVLTLNIADHGPLDHFTWEFTPPTAWAGKPFAVRVTARDAGERVVDSFAGSAAIAASREGNASSAVLITEITDEAEDQFELQNVTGSAVSTAGWFVVLGDSTTNVSFRNPLTYYLPASMAAGAMLRISEANTAGRIYFGGPINWASSGTSRGWVMLFDAGYNLRDFVAFGWAAADLANLSLTVNGKSIAPLAAGEWSGGGLTVGPRGNSSQTTDSWQRVGGSDGNAPSDWQWMRLGASFGVTNSGLNLPFVSAMPLTLTPSSASFANGTFTGYLSIAEPGSAARLTATNGPATSNSPLIDILDATDSDGDGLPDSYEATHSLLPGTPDGHLDKDGDSQTNLAEFVAGTAPDAKASVLAVSGHDLGSGHEYLTIRWQAVAGVYYRIMAADDLAGWSPVAFRLATADGVEEVTVPAGGLPRYFLRVEVVPWPSP